MDLGVLPASGGAPELVQSGAMVSYLQAIAFFPVAFPENPGLAPHQQ
jgi:hypothetical protein